MDIAIPAALLNRLAPVAIDAQLDIVRDATVRAEHATVALAPPCGRPAGRLLNSSEPASVAGDVNATLAATPSRVAPRAGVLMHDLVTLEQIDPLRRGGEGGRDPRGLRLGLARLRRMVRREGGHSATRPCRA